MRHLIPKAFFLACCAFVSCKSRDDSRVDNSTWLKHKSWVKYELNKYWVFNAPKGTKIIYLDGIDSVPGVIVLAANDSINLEFDSGFEMSFRDTVCNLGSEAVHAKRRIARGYYKYLDKPDTLHQAKIDTVDGRIATFISPVKPGYGTTEVNISDCESNRWLAIYGRNIPSNKQQLITEIYESIRHESSR
jgi:hypothetical protein